MGGFVGAVECDRAVKEFSVYPSPFRRYTTSKFYILTSFAYKPEVGGIKWRHQPVAVDGGYNPSLGHDIAGSRSGDIRRWIFFANFP